MGILSFAKGPWGHQKLGSRCPVHHILKNHFQALGQRVPSEFADLPAASLGQPLAQLGITEQTTDLTAQQERVGEGHDKSRLAVDGKITGAACRTDDGKAAGHSLGGRVGPTRPPLSADKQISPGIEPGHFVLRKVKIEFMGNGSPDKGPRVKSIFANQAVEKNETKSTVPAV